MPRQAHKDQPDTCDSSQCQERLGRFEEALAIFGDAQTLFIIHSLSEGGKRYCELQRAVGNMNPTTLAKRLKKLEALHLIERREETVDKVSVSYSLSEKGRHMLPVLVKIKDYADRFLG